MKYKRILLKLSGESLMGKKQFGIDNERIAQYAIQIKEIVDMGVQVAIVIGGGNIFRGIQAEEGGVLFPIITSLTIRPITRRRMSTVIALASILMEIMHAF